MLKPAIHHVSESAPLLCKTVFIADSDGRVYKNSSVFHGACVDTGAQKTVIGKPQAVAYSRMVGVKFKPSRSRHSFRFGSDVQSSLGSMPIRIPTGNGGFLPLNVEVVDIDVPLLIGLDFLKKEKLYPDTVDNKLVCKESAWHVPLTQKFGHLYYDWSATPILYTRSELIRLHKHFFHPSSAKLFELIKRSSPAEADAETRKVLHEISERCKTCQHLNHKSHRFRVSMPKECIFNEELALDLMFLEGKAILHVVDTRTHFSSAAFLDSQSVDGVWAAFLSAWTTLYVGYPSKMRVDQGSIFTSRRWKQLTDATGISLQLSGIESHNSIGAGERYHAPLRRIYDKVLFDFPNLDKHLGLKLAVKAMNDTMGPEGLVPSMLVFGVLPRFPVSTIDLPNQVDRMNALKSARAEMETIACELKLAQALRSKLPPAADYQLSVGDQVLVKREKIAAAQGPFPIVEIDADGKQIFILDEKGAKKQFSVSQIRPYYQEPSDILFSHINDMLHDFRSEPASAPAHDTPEKNICSTHVSEVIKCTDPRSLSDAAISAKRKEIGGLLSRKTWKVVCERDVPTDANIMGGRFVLTLKDVGTDKPFFKARYVVQGHRDKDKDYLVHDSTTLHQHSTKLILSLAAIFGFRIWNQDVTQAYTQSDKALMRQVFVRPKKKDLALFEMSSDELLEILRPLYGIPDASDYWDATMVSHMLDELGLTRARIDLSLFYQRKNETLVGLSGTCVDDSIHAGKDEYLTLTEKSQQRFLSRERKFDTFDFIGAHIATNPDGSFSQSQQLHISRLSELPLTASFDEFRSARAKIPWITHTRPEHAYYAQSSAQITEQLFNSTHIKEYNSTVRALKENKEKDLQYQRLDEKTLRITAYSDASFANNTDLSSQLGYIIFLSDASQRCNVVAYRSYKSRRKTRSVLGGEVLAFADAFDASYALRRDLEKMLGKAIPISVLTDSKSLFDIITKSSATLEKRLMIDVAAAREAYGKQELNDIGLISSENNPADAFTKGGLKAKQMLLQVLATGSLNHKVEQWIYR